MRYTTDLTDTEWELIDCGFPKRAKTRRPRQRSYRKLLNAMFYVVRTACPWRNLPKDFAPWQTVYPYYQRWKRNQLWKPIHTHLGEHLRQVEGRKRQVSAASLDSQSVKSSECSAERGDDAGKQVNGRKRHMLVDTLGLVLGVMIPPANLQDRDAARQLRTLFF
ncbi:MAG TPA: IS5 family transposase [Verrucomicrobiota bacterium]|jgi:putative transposase|nr:MAG: hypothetical protein BWX84_01919 [Verrucomicrobia bacterium ADurb.Bin118]HPY31908.1 IS5 family transposase [Verrucomicrobiota bacterium]HQB18115.1 IS5 family transposase [Verrucomicrobiota bacterium]